MESVFGNLLKGDGSEGEERAFDEFFGTLSWKEDTLDVPYTDLHGAGNAVSQFGSQPIRRQYAVTDRHHRLQIASLRMLWRLE